MTRSKITDKATKSFFDDRAEAYNGASECWPWSWLREKERAALLAGMGSVRDQTVLDLGCGSGYFSRLFAKQGASKVVGVDISESMIAQLPDNDVEGVVGNITIIELEYKFNRISCAGVLEFIPDPVAALENAPKHIDPDGRMVLLVPLQNLWGRLYRLYHYSHGVQINLFRPAEIDRIARQTGWRQMQGIYVAPFTWIAILEPAGN